jgi:hypothetical protein
VKLRRVLDALSQIPVNEVKGYIYEVMGEPLLVVLRA